MSVECRYQERCSGCQLLGTPLEDQHELKKAELRRLLQNAGLELPAILGLSSPAAVGLRDRADFVYEDGALGLYEKGARKILDLEICLQLSPALQIFLSEVRNIRWPIKKGSLRLRVGPRGEKGLWLDFANVDVKSLLDEKSILLGLMKIAHIEIGQRHKVLTLVGDQLKLKDPEPRVWFQTHIGSQAVDLFCSIGSFTQPGHQANQELGRIIESWLSEARARHILEFGSGIGNLSFPALGQDRRLTACEIDRDALEGFARSLQQLSQQKGFADIQERVQIQQGDFQNRNPQNFGDYDTVLVNPPRSGLKEFLAPLIAEKNKPRYFLYMSCFPESFALDGRRLQEAGYRLQKLQIVDQFPQTTHYEVLSFWSLQD